MTHEPAGSTHGLSELGRVNLVRRLVCLFTLALLISSWKLWLPQATFPQVPLFSSLVGVPWFADRLLTSLFVVSLLIAGVGRRSPRVVASCLLLAATCCVILMTLNQQRIQPWAYLSLLVCLLLAGCPAQQSLSWLRALMISIYFFSALSKFDYLFVTTIGQQFLAAGFNCFGVSIQAWSVEIRTALALGLPLGELLTSLCLCIPPLRRLGVASAILLHGILIVLLGPWGMDQKAAVLIWNLQFCVLVPLIFWPRRRLAASSHAEIETPSESLLANALSMAVRGMVLLAILLPWLEGLGYWDPWLSWGLYSTRTARVELYFAENVVPGFPASLQEHISTETHQGFVRKFYLDRWSLAELDVPIYPHDRFGVGVTLALLEQLDLDRGVMIVYSSAPERRTGERTQRRITTAAEIQMLPNRYRLNALPREGFRLPARPDATGTPPESLPR